MLRVILLIIALTLLACSDPSKQKQDNSMAKQIESQTKLLSDSGQSSFEQFEHGYKAVEVTYQPTWAKRDGTAKGYIAKITNSRVFISGAMRAERKIKVEMILGNPSKPEFTIEKECDELNLKDDYYEVIVRGCCGAEDEIEYYDYNGQLIVQGTTQITACEIPNSPLKFYAAYGYQQGLQLSYNSQDKYRIDLKFPLGADNNCGPMVPEIYFRSANKKDGLVDGTYNFWSLDGIERSDQVNDISLLVVYSCIENLDTLTIPIINGKPFGRNDRSQILEMKVKSDSLQ